MIGIASASAWAGDTSVEILAGARGNPERAIEQPVEAESGELEPNVQVALLATTTRHFDDGPFVGIGAEVWGYAPATYASLFRVVPKAGLILDVGPHGHLDGAARVALEAVPARREADSARGEGTADVGLSSGPHRFDLLVTGVDKEYPFTPVWTFRTAEVGLQWTALPPGVARLQLRASGQSNQGSILEDDYREAVYGTQLRLFGAVGITPGAWDFELAYRFGVSQGGADDHALRPIFTPIGDYDDDADALSAGGWYQHRVDATISGAFGEHYTFDALALLRVRSATPSGPPPELARTRHARVNLGRSLGPSWSVHLSAGWTDVVSSSGIVTLDPTAWLALRWSR